MIDASKPYRAKNMIINILETNNGTGFLEVSVFSDQTNEPISGAEVSVYKFIVRGVYGEAGDEELIVAYITDENGKVPIIELPVIHGVEANNGKADYSRIQYHMSIKAFGYNTVTVINMEIFRDQTLVFNVNLSPNIPGENRSEFIIIPEKHR